MNLFRNFSLLLLTCGLLPAQTTSLTATKDDGTPAATKKPAGSTVTYSNTITNTGANAATSLSFADPDITNATLVPGSVHISPLAINDAYETIANTQITVGPSAGSSPEVYVNSTVRANDQTLNPPGGTDTSSIVSSTSPANGTLVAFDNATGAFTYLPNAGFVGTDTFTYTVRNDADTSLTDTATVSIVVKDANPSVSGNQSVWYVKNDGAAGNGRSSAPFNTLAGAQSASAAGDTIYVFTGDGTTTNQNAGIALKSGQRLIGQGVALTVPVQVNGGAATTTLNLAGSQPRVGNSAGNGVAVNDIIPAEIQGLSLSGSANAIDFTYGAAVAPTSATCQIKNNTLFGAGAEGIDINKDGNFTLGLDIQSNAWNAAGTHTGNAVDILRTAAGTPGLVQLVLSNNSLLSTGGTAVNIAGNSGVTITGFSGNVISGNTTGSGIVCDSVLFDADTGIANFQQVAGGVTVVGGSGNGVGAGGIALTNTSGDLAFADLDVFADGGTALRATAAATYTGAAGFRVVVADGLGSLVASAGPAVDASVAQLNLPNVLATSSGSATFGANFSDTDGSTFTTRTGSSIGTSNPAATAFRVTNATGTYTFTGPITTSAGKGVELTNNSGATIGFTGGLSLSTGANPAFVATGGGTVTATQNNSTIVNTLTTTSAQALNVANTTIGAAGLTFRSISSSAGANNGITLNTTGSSGGLSVVGTGSAGSGGTISGKTGANGSTTDGIGIYLNSTSNVSLDRMNLQNFQNFAIRGFNVNGFSLLNSTVNTTSGFNGNDDASNEGSIAFGDQNNASLSGLSGTVAITNCVIANGFENNFVVSNHTGTMSFTMTGSTVSDTSTVSPGNEGLAFYAEGSSIMNISVQSSSFLRNRANGIHVINQSTGTVTFDLGAPGSAGSGGTFTDNTLGVNIAGNDSGPTNFDILNATFTVPNFPTLYNAGGASSQININMGGDAVVAERGAMSGNILNNSVNMNGSPTGPAVRIIANGTDNTGGNTITFLFDNNTVTGGENYGVHVFTRDGNAGINATITNNTVTTNDGPLIAGNGAAEAFRLDAGATSTAAGTGVPDSGFFNLDFANNSAETPDATGLFDVRVRQRFSTTYRLEDIGGGTNTSATAITYLAGRNPLITGAPTITADNTAAGSAGFLDIADVTEPSAPLLYAPGEPEDLDFGTPDSVESAVAWTETARQRGLDAASTVSPVSPNTPSPESSANKGDERQAAQASLTQAEINPLVSAARQRWTATGLTAAQLGTLENIRFKVADLPGWYLGEHTASEVRLDVTAGGNGWYVDATPMDDQEFTVRETSLLRAPDGSPASDRIDLLATIMHEMGHRLGLSDGYSSDQRGSIMYGFLTKGERRLPVKGQADGAVPHAHSTAHHLGAPITISELPAGKSVTIKYSVTVNNDPLNWVGATLSSQATVSSGNAVGAAGYFAPVVTDDPESPAPDDATITLLDRPDATVASINRTVGTPNKEASVTWQVVLSTSIKGLTSSNLSLTTTGTIAGASITGVVADGGTATDDTWNVTVNTGTGDGTIDLNLINDTGLTHDLTNLSYTGQTITIDKTVPTVAMSSLAPDPTNTSPIPVSVTFSETVSGFTAGEITAGNATISNFAGSGANYTFDLVPSGQGTVTADIAADVAQDDAGNNNTAAIQFSRTFDNVAPTVAMTSITGNPTVNAAIPVTVTFSESVSGFTSGNIVPGNGTVQNFAGSGADYTFDLVPSGPGVIVTADIAAAVAQDSAGNSNTAATQFSRTIVDQVSIAATTGTAVEGGATGLYTFTRGLTSGSLTVNFQLDGSSTTTAGTDFELSGTGLSFNNGSGAGSIVIPDGFATATITFTALVESPNAAEAAESARLNLTTGTGYVAAAAPNDNATVTITANSFLVTTTADSGTGSLRQAVLNANSIAGTDTIAFSDGTGGTVDFTDATLDTIVLTGGQISISESMNLPGAGSEKLAISGNNASRVLIVETTAASVNLSGLSITNGFSSSGAGFNGGGGQLNLSNVVMENCVSPVSSGGFYFWGDFLVMENCVVRNNTSTDNGAGANIEPTSYAVVKGCLFSGNTAGGSSGGLYITRGAVINTTISGNTANGTLANQGGGGVRVQAAGTVTFTSCTITGNNAPNAASGARSGLWVDTGTTSLNHCLISGNGAGDITKNTGTLINAGNNLLGRNTTVETEFPAGPLVGTAGAPVDPLIGSLADNGGLSFTHALLAGSPALNAGTAPAQSELQSIDPGGSVSGVYTLTFAGQTTGALAYNASAAAIQAALEALSTIGAGNVLCADLDGTRRLVVFTGTLASVNQPTLLTNGAGGAIVIAGTIQDGGALTTDQRGPGFARTIGNADIGAFELQKSVSIADVAAANEGNSGTTNFVFTITRSGDTTGDVNMTYTVGGAAVNAADFGGTLPTGSATITSGNTSTTLSIPVGGDTLVELNEAFTVTLSSPDNGYVVSGAPAASTITNDDSATLSIAKITDGAEANTPTNGKFRVTQSATSSTDTTVSYTVSGAATSGTDFTALSGSVTIPAGSTTADIDVAVLNEGNELEPTETVLVTLDTVTAGSSSITVGSPNAATVNITDDDTATVTIAKITDGAEPGTPALFRITQSATATEDTIVTFTTGGSAISGTDFSGLSGTKTIPAGSTTADIMIEIIDETLVEGTETVSLTLTGFNLRDPDVSLGATVLATADIADNDSATVTISEISHGYETGPTTGVFRVAQSAQSSTDTIVTYTVGGAATSGSDFTALSGSVTIPAGLTTADVDIAPIDDAIVEADETVSLTVTGITGGDPQITLGATLTANSFIQDNDSATVTIAKITDGVEAAVPTNAVFRVTQTAEASVDTVVSYSVGGSATSGSDFTALGGSVTIPAGSTTADITVSVLNENEVEATENISLTLTGFTARDPEVTLGATVNATADITDSDTATVTIAKIVDGSETGPAGVLFRVTQTAPATVDTVVTYTVGGTATPGSDFTALSGSVTVPAGQTTAELGVIITDDGLVEATETISLTLTGFTARDPDVSLGATVNDIADVTDNDSATVTIAKINDGGETGPANALFRVTQSAQSSSITTLTYSVGGAAVSGSDFNALSGSVSIPAGSTTADITVTVADDAIVEATEAVELTLTGFTAGDAQITLGATVLASADITDNDSATVTIAKINDGVEAAAPTNALFRVTQTAEASVDTVVSYTVGGSATSGSDFTALGGSVTIPAGSTTADITVAVLDENVVEATENVSLTLTGFTARDPEVTLGATVNASADITDSDTSVITLAAVNADQNEGTGGATTSFTFSATLSNPVQGGFTIAYSTNDGTALTADSDYQDNDSTLDFTGTAAESKTITVLVNHDGTNEVDETFTVALGAISGTTLGGSLSTTGTPQTGTIRNDDALTISIAAPDADADENNTATGTFRVSRNGVLGDTTVQLAIDGSSSAAATDWTQSGASFASLAPGATGTATIPNGQTSVDITLTPASDIHAEAAETARLNVTADAAYVIGSPADATVTIGQNDFVVINTNDDGEGSLRQAILNANALAGADDITFAGTVFTDATTPDVITLTTGELEVSSDLRILGLGADVLHVGGGGTSRVFQIPNVAANVTLDGLTVRDGAANSGGGIENRSSANVIVHRCVISGNSAGSVGGGINHGGSGTLRVRNSTLSSNSASTNGGGLRVAVGSVFLANVTISGNSSGQGGGIGVISGNLQVLNTTLTANSATGNGGGLHIQPNILSIQLGNNIISGNTAPAAADIRNDASNGVVSLGGNMVKDYVGDASVFATGNPNAQGDYVDSTINPLLGPLQNNGGTTPTHELLPGSPAINRGVNANLPQDTLDVDGDNDTTETLPLDQALQPRIYDNPTIPTDIVDIGAFESQNSPPTVVAPGIADVNKIEDDPAFTIDLLPHFADAEQANTTLTYTVFANSNPSLVSAAITGGTNVEITPQADQTGFADITIRATDNGNLTVEDTFRVTITKQVDLVASVVESFDPVLAGVGVPGNLTHQVQVLNNGPSDATNVTVNVAQTLPAGVTLASSSATSGAFAAGVWTIPSIAENTMQTLTLTLTVAANTAAGTDTIITTGTVNGVTEPIVTTGDDTDTERTSVFSASAMPLSLTTGLFGNFQNGLIEQKIRVTNNNTGRVPAFRVVITGLPADVTVFNKQGTTSTGAPYILWNQPLDGNGGIANLLVQFHRASGIANFSPVYTVELLGAPETATLPGGAAQVTISRTLRMTDGAFLVEWISIPGRSYRVRWSPDMSTWHDVLPDVKAVANKTQWIDAGPPQTTSHPSTADSRFYQIHLLP